MEQLKRIWKLIVSVVYRFFKDQCTKQGAAISFYMIFSLPAILVLMMGLASTLLGRAEVLTYLQENLTEYADAQTAAQVSSIIEHYHPQKATSLTKWIGLFTVLFGATGFFYSLQGSIRAIWKLNQIKVSPKVIGIRFLIHRLFSLGMVFVLGLILVASMLLEAVLLFLKRVVTNLDEDWIQRWLVDYPRLNELIPHLDIMMSGVSMLDLLLGTGLILLAIMMVFRYLPGAKICATDGWIGALVTTLLMILGRRGFSLYLSHGEFTETYGAAASIVLLLLWVYYSVLTILIGAEVVYVAGKSKGRVPESLHFAERVSKTKVWKWKPPFMKKSSTGADKSSLETRA
ncbi:YihY/virulence factor BrkB family protein [Pontibacter sp. G13]|uniref:YihY/virulence factor BrkB family protein n=1 Tax=Pontibacter sp. G13 TaxID=3074898 RepID=UPI00288BD30E|nr:YihY/virulence factor BrkB family protein [Pontibacter sp. G13]WNJ20871.1 YihY/virulence factor BrkB family protein [Pontibacter sp. G13]